MHSSSGKVAPRSQSSQYLKCFLKSTLEQQKAYYDKHAKHLQPLHPQQVVRLQTEKGHEKIGIVKQPAAKPKSYFVQTEGKECRRNRKNLLAVPEPVPT